MKIAALIPVYAHVSDKKKKSKINIKNYFGLSVIINEIKLKLNIDVVYCSYDQVNNYDVIIYSLLSVNDYYALVYTVERKLKCKRNNIWICGGAGISNIYPLLNYFDFIVLGRGELLIIELINSIKLSSQINNDSIVVVNEFNNNKVYKINYVDDLYQDKNNNLIETMSGCKYNCLYCSYRYSSLPPNLRSKNKGTTMIGNEETFWDLKIINGSFYTTSLDGLTEMIRYKVNKKISNKMVVDKLVAASKVTSKVNLKIYFIIGYPDELEFNFDELYNIFELIDNLIINCKMFINIHFTPFSAEQFTPMQWESMNIITDWRLILDKMRIENKYLYYSDDIRVMFMRTTSKPLELLKRAVFNRCDETDNEIIKYLGSNPEQTTHKSNNTIKLDKVLQKYDVSKFVKEYPIGSKLASSNIKSWQKDELIERQGSNFRRIK